MNTPAVDVIPIGGLGQFGMNCTLFRDGDHILVVDAGMMFPPGELWGIDAIVPDLGPVLDGGARVSAIVLTHAHDDHIGGVSYLMERTDCPVYGSDLTLAHARQRLRDRAIEDRDRLTAVSGRDTIEAGPFHVEFLDVTHSVPGSFALVIGTRAGAIVHSADFKLDATPVDGRTTDLERLLACGREGVKLLLLDSTNAVQDGTTPSERSVGEAFEALFRNAPGRIFLTTFSSHVHRVQQAIDCASRADRKVAILGRRMTASFRLARETGRLRVPAGAVLDPEAALKLPRASCLVIAGGSQGEPVAAMTRIARGEHPEARIEPGDLVLHSARPIPGNEVAIGRMLDDLARRGAELVGADRAGIHVSGHASRDDLAELIDAVRPEALVPVHGTFRHLRACARLAASRPHPPREILLVSNGDVVRVGEDGPARLAGRLEVPPILVDRECDPVDERTLRDRRHLGSDGLLVPLVVIDRSTRKLRSPPDVIARGFVPSDRDGALLREAARLVTEAIERAEPPANGDLPLGERIQEDVRRLVRRRTGKRPLVAPIIVEI